MIRRVVHFSGRVQGVGFRISTASIARAHDVAGTVENLPDGRVRLVAQGDSEQVHGFLAEVDRELGRHVLAREATNQPLDPTLAAPESLHAFRVIR